MRARTVEDMNLPPHLLIDFALQRQQEALDRAANARLAASLRPEKPKRRVFQLRRTPQVREAT